MKFRATLTYEYEINPKDYNTKDIEEMLKIDRECFEDDPGFMLEDGKIKVEKI